MPLRVTPRSAFHKTCICKSCTLEHGLPFILPIPCHSVLSNRPAARAGTGSAREFSRVIVHGGAIQPRSRLVVVPGNSNSSTESLLLVDSTHIRAMACTTSNMAATTARGQESDSYIACTIGAALATQDFGTVVGAERLGAAAFIASARGLFRCPTTPKPVEGGARARTHTRTVHTGCVRLLPEPMTALAVHAPSGTAAAGSKEKVWVLSASGQVKRWEWVTAIDGPDMGSGGVLDGSVKHSLEY